MSRLSRLAVLTLHNDVAEEGPSGGGPPQPAWRTHQADRGLNQARKSRKGAGSRKSIEAERVPIADSPISMNRKGASEPDPSGDVTSSPIQAVLTQSGRAIADNLVNVGGKILAGRVGGGFDRGMHQYCRSMRAPLGKAPYMRGERHRSMP